MFEGSIFIHPIIIQSVYHGYIYNYWLTLLITLPLFSVLYSITAICDWFDWYFIVWCVAKQKVVKMTRFQHFDKHFYNIPTDFPLLFNIVCGTYIYCISVCKELSRRKYLMHSSAAIWKCTSSFALLPVYNATDTDIPLL